MPTPRTARSARDLMSLLVTATQGAGGGGALVATLSAWLVFRHSIAGGAGLGLN